jgi:hypothetical protein
VQVQAAGSSKIPVTTYINAEHLNSENGLFKWHFFHTYELFHGDFLITKHYKKKSRNSKLIFVLNTLVQDKFGVE